MLFPAIVFVAFCYSSNRKLIQVVWLEWLEPGWLVVKVFSLQNPGHSSQPRNRSSLNPRIGFRFQVTGNIPVITVCFYSSDLILGHQYVKIHSLQLYIIALLFYLLV